MPETLLASGSDFDRHRALLGGWLRDNLAAARSVTRDILNRYGDSHDFVAGWQVEIEQGGERFHFYVLVDAHFPYSTIRIGLPSAEPYLVWPHVEPAGLLCLPRLLPPTSGLVEVVLQELLDAIELVKSGRDPTFVEQELQQEFRAYWDRSIPKDALAVRSLLDTRNLAARHVAIWEGTRYTLVGEKGAQVLCWLVNMGRSKESKIIEGIFAHLDEAPIPPFPDRPPALCAFLEAHCPDALPLLRNLPINETVTVVLSADSPSGVGLIALDLTPPKLNGFRRGTVLRPEAKMVLWKTRSSVIRRKALRYDPSWVHGRNVNKDLPKLSSATVLMLGCGSLGSQVAMRLAQAGVGGMHLVDPDTLIAANVGRHALGINSVDQNKADALAKHLRGYYPHMHTLEAWGQPWQAIYEKKREIIDQSSLIVACIGGWSEEGQLGELHAREEISQPIVYGWLDEFGAASHALALGAGKPALSCVLGPNGDLRVPETLWTKDGLLQAEPACGTLFQPFGPLDVSHAEALVARLVIDILTGLISPPTHRVYAGPTASLIEAGGEWSVEHRKHRPHNYDGPFEYTREVVSCGDCSACHASP